MDKKKILVGAVAATVLVIGAGTAIAAGQQSQDAGTGNAQEEQETAIKGTIPAPEAKDEENKAAETKRLEGLAKIDKAAAEKAALDVVPGEVKKTELDDEDGFVVYDVDVLGKDGKTTELKVDAGDGKVLAQETEDNDDREDAGDNEVDE
jgi:uncharacterized membrane protein YkoI